MRRPATGFVQVTNNSHYVIWPYFYSSHDIIIVNFCIPYVLSPPLSLSLSLSHTYTLSLSHSHSLALPLFLVYTVPI